MQIAQLSCKTLWCQAEKVAVISDLTSSDQGSQVRETVLVLTFVTPAGEHAFCSRYDFGPWPLQSELSKLTDQTLQVSSRCLQGCKKQVAGYHEAVQ